MEISDSDGGLFLGEHRFFAGNAFMQMTNSSSEVLRCRARTRELRSTETRAVLMQSYSRLNGNQTSVFAIVMGTPDQERNMDTTHPAGKESVLKGGTGVEKT